MNNEFKTSAKNGIDPLYYLDFYNYAVYSAQSYKTK